MQIFRDIFFSDFLQRYTSGPPQGRDKRGIEPIKDWKRLKATRETRALFE